MNNLPDNLPRDLPGDLPTPGDKVEVVEAMFDRIAPRYDLVNHVMTGGLDTIWRRAAVRRLGLPRGARVADLACGTGAFCRDLRRAGYWTLGVDSAAGMLARAWGADEFLRADILELPLDDAAFDGVTCGFALRNVADIGRSFREMARILRPGGRLAVLDLVNVGGPLHRLQRLYLDRAVPLIGGLLSDRQAYRYLPASTTYLPPPHELLAMCREVGFEDVRRRLFGLGTVQLIVGTRAVRTRAVGTRPPDPLSEDVPRPGLTLQLALAPQPGSNGGLRSCRSTC